MLGLRLGEFGKGFVKGFAEEANEALKNDIQRINARVEKVADFRVKRAVEEQEERKKDLEDIEDALREAEGLFGKDDPRAASYAASLLKEQGSTSALRAFVNQIKGSDAYQRGESLTNYMQVMEQDMPTATRTEYAQAFLGAPKATPDYRLPEDAVTAGAGNLISALGFKPDVSGRIERETAEQMAAMGVGAPVTTEVTLPSAVFQKERWMLTNKTPTDRLEYINNQLANPEITDDRRTELMGMREKALVAVSNTGNLQDQITVLETRLSTATGEEAESLMAEIVEKKQEARLRDARTSDNPMDLVDANIAIALREAVKSGDYTEYRRLVDEKSKMGKEPTLEDEIKEAYDDLARDVSNNVLVQGSEAYNQRLAAIRKDEKILKDMQPDKPINVSLAAGWGNLMQEAIDADVVKNLPPETRGQYVAIKKELEANPDMLATLEERDPNLYKIYMDGQAIEKNVRVSAIERVLAGVSEEDNPDAYYAARSIFNYGGAAQSAAIEAGAEASAGATPAASTATVAELAAAGDKLREKFSDDAEGANKMINAVLRSGIPIQAALDDAKAKGYKNPDFIAAFEAELGQDSAVAKMAIEDIEMDEDAKPLTPVTLAKQMRQAKTLEEYEAAKKRYISITGRDEEAVEKSFPPPAQDKNRGGLMSRK